MTIQDQREQTVRAHINAECRGDVAATLETFHHPRYEVIPFGAPVDGSEGVRDLLSGLLAAFPDFNVTLSTMRHAPDAVICEIDIHGTHRGPWMGLEGTGKKIKVPAACFFLFEENRLVCERVYFDAATMRGQLTA